MRWKGEIGLWLYGFDRGYIALHVSISGYVKAHPKAIL